MKKCIVLFIVLTIFVLTIIFHGKIVNFIVDHFSEMNKKATVLENNRYASDTNYMYVKLTDNFFPENKQDIMNIYYTIINSGMTDFVFYCSKDYDNCLEDVNYISNNQKMLSYINNFVPVYNSFKNIETEFDSLGKVSVHITHNYSKSEINEINKKLEYIIDNVIKDDASEKEKIKAIHDYIINNTKYDKERSDDNVDKYKSDTAYGALIQGYSICGGYADSVKLLLDHYNIPNFKVSSENHIWNVVKINNKWLHLDLTWDDPVTNTGEDVLEYNYFLITGEELEKLETEQHKYDLEVYKELEKAK